MIQRRFRGKKSSQTPFFKPIEQIRRTSLQVRQREVCKSLKLSLKRGHADSGEMLYNFSFHFFVFFNSGDFFIIVDTLVLACSFIAIN